MIKDRYQIKWVGRCTYDTSDKIWGWMYYYDSTIQHKQRSQTYAYVFWGATGKTLSFKRHLNQHYYLTNLCRTKQHRGYKEITVAEAEGLWTDFYTTMNEKFVYHLLAENI